MTLTELRQKIEADLEGVRETREYFAGGGTLQLQAWKYFHGRAVSLEWILAMMDQDEPEEDDADEN